MTEHHLFDHELAPDDNIDPDLIFEIDSGLTPEYKLLLSNIWKEFEAMRTQSELKTKLPSVEQKVSQNLEIIHGFTEQRPSQSWNVHRPYTDTYQLQAVFGFPEHLPCAVNGYFPHDAVLSKFIQFLGLNPSLNHFASGTHFGNIYNAQTGEKYAAVVRK